MTKNKRIVLSLSKQAKQTIEQAARLSNVSLSSYILTAAIKQALLDLEQKEVFSLSNTERDSLMKALENPPIPNNSLSKLLN